MIAAVSCAAAYVLLPRLVSAARHWHTLSSPLWIWVATVGVATVVMHLMGAVVLTSSTTRRLRFSTTVSVGLASTFANRLAPSGLGAMATNARYLHRRGSSPEGAAVSVGLGSTAGFIIHAVGTSVAVALVAPQLLSGWRPPSYWPWLLAGILVLAAVGALWARGRSGRIREILRSSVKELRGVLACPRRTVGLFGGCAGITLANALALAAAFNAYRVHIGLLEVLAVYLGASALAAGSPTPGGMGAAEAALIAAASTLVGQATRVVDAVLLFRLITFWIPPLAGIPALVHLRRNAVL